jgi:ribosomal protein S18 acetylase RimI-like enzyme
MINVRRARPDDAPGIAAVHVAAWRSAYAGILDEAYLAHLSETRLAAFYHRAILDRAGGHAVFVAAAGGSDRPEDAAGPEEASIIGFASGGKARRTGLAEGEVETLYVLDDYRERAVGRRLMRAMAAHLRAIGCGSALVWVLSDNPANWFYRHLGGKPVMTEEIRVAGRPVQQSAYAWDPIDVLLSATASVKEG